MLSTRQLMETLISFKPVTSDIKAVNSAVQFLDQYLTENGVFTAVENLGERKILYASTGTGKSPRILLNAHLDVVPADDAFFSVTEDGDWLCGRGTHDCLGNSAMLANLLIKLNQKADIGVVFSSDEETGGVTTKTMVEHGYRGRELVVIVDGSGYSLVIAQKGVLSVTLQAGGQSCHAARPWEGDNPIDKLIEGYLKIRGLFPAVNPPDEWHDTMAATTIQAGSVHNKVPDQAVMSLNIRTTEKTDQSELLESIGEISGLDVKVEMQCPPVSCNPEQPALDALRKHMQKFLARDIDIKRSNGATDARHFIEGGAPIAIIGVPGRDIHGDKEAVSASGLEEYEAMLLKFMQP
ncbi:MAG: M20/M25/M40 family metallo-hydrolase [Lentisphaeria bacterium]